MSMDIEKKGGAIPRLLDEIVICQFVESLYISKDIVISMMMADGIEIGVDTIWFQWRHYITEKAHEFLTKD